MAHSLLPEAPVPAAVWSARFGIFALLVALIGVGLSRLRAIDPLGAMVVVSSAWLMAAAAGLLAVSAAGEIWRTARPGIGTALAGFACALLLLAPAAYLAVEAVRLPLLDDVSTDLADPPDFMRTARAMAGRGGSVPAPFASAPDAQRRAYPNVQPVILDLDIDEAWPLVLKAVSGRGWRIVDQNLPGARLRIGHIDAVDRTIVMGFPADIAVRVKPLAGQTRVDVRSVSRFGRHDFGSNARRIAGFAAELQAQLDAR